MTEYSFKVALKYFRILDISISTADLSYCWYLRIFIPHKGGVLQPHLSLISFSTGRRWSDWPGQSPLAMGTSLLRGPMNREWRLPCSQTCHSSGDRNDDRGGGDRAYPSVPARFPAFLLYVPCKMSLLSSLPVHHTISSPFSGQFHSLDFFKIFLQFPNYDLRNPFYVCQVTGSCSWLPTSAQWHGRLLVLHT